jgi:hypothetical protein
MVPKSLVLKVALQLLGVGSYFALVVVLCWKWLWDVGAVVIIVGLLFLFKTAAESGAISIAHLSPVDPEFNIRSLSIELSKALTFFGVGMGAWIDLAKALEAGLVPGNLPTAVIYLMLVCIFAICVACCLARFSVALKNRPRR